MVLAKSYRGKLRKSSVVVDGFLGEIYTQDPPRTGSDTATNRSRCCFPPHDSCVIQLSGFGSNLVSGVDEKNLNIKCFASAAILLCDMTL